VSKGHVSLLFIHTFEDGSPSFFVAKRTPGGVLQVEDIQDFTNNTSGEESKPALKNNDEGWQQYEAGRT